jgi:hypothetical protein
VSAAGASPSGTVVLVYLIYHKRLMIDEWGSDGFRHCRAALVSCRDHLLHRSVVNSTFRVLRQFVCDLVPRSSIFHVSVKLRPNSGIIIEGSHANRYLRTVRPVAAEQARAAVHTESFHRAFTFSINLDQLFALQQAKLFLVHARLRANRRSRMFAATIAMTMTGADKRRIDFKPNPAAKTTASDNFLHSKP